VEILFIYLNSITTYANCFMTLSVIL